MKRVGRRLGVVLCVGILVAAGFPAAPSSAITVGLSQTILPLQCTVDVVNVGATFTISLSPAVCTKSPEAAQLLRQAILERQDSR